MNSLDYSLVARVISVLSDSSCCSSSFSSLPQTCRIIFPTQTSTHTHTLLLHALKHWKSYLTEDKFSLDQNNSLIWTLSQWTTEESVGHACHNSRTSLFRLTEQVKSESLPYPKRFTGLISNQKRNESYFFFNRLSEKQKSKSLAIMTEITPWFKLWLTEWEKS